MSGGNVARAAGGGGDPQHGHGAGLPGRVPDTVEEQPIGDRSFPRGQKTGRGSRCASKKNYRAYKRSLSRKERKRLRSLMHDFRRRPQDLKPDQKKELEALFNRVPVLGQIYHQRWEVTAIFDTAPDRTTAEKQLQEWIAEVRTTGLDWQPFIT